MQLRDVGDDAEILKELAARLVRGEVFELLPIDRVAIRNRSCELFEEV